MDARAKNAKIYARDPHEWYVEPGRCTEQLLTVEQFPGTVLDPCCGRGNIVETFNRLCGATKAVGTDLIDRFPEGRPAWHRGTFDFLQPDEIIGADSIVMNPPFGSGKLAEAFIRHALRLARYKVAVFVDVRFLGGAKRAAGLYADRCPNRVWYVTPRPSCPPGEHLAAGGKASGGTADFCWLVYDLTAPPPDFYTGGWLRAPQATEATLV